jgi:hypothetical protein
MITTKSTAERRRANEKERLVWTSKEKMAKTPYKVEQRKESAAGFHFVNLFSCCQRKFYIRYFKRFKSIWTPMPLIQGSAFHEGKAAFYSGEPEKSAISIAMKIVNGAKKELESIDIYNELKFRIPNLLHYFIETNGKSDKKQFKFLMIEKELKVPLGQSPFMMTIRPDAVIQDRHSGMVYIMETKTSGFSIRVTEQAVLLGDQATAYLFGVKKKYPKLQPFGVIPDIAYWNKKSRDLANMSFPRGEIVLRDDFALGLFEKGMIQLFTEINQKAAAYKKGMDPAILFPRNSHYCTSFSTPCQYASICQTNLEEYKRAPRGMTIDKGIKDIGGYVEDEIAIT